MFLSNQSKFPAKSLAIALMSGVMMTTAHANAADTIKIGVASSQSGPLSTLFAELKRATDFAVAEANAAGGINGQTVEVRYADTEGKPDVARKQAEKLALEGFNLMTGPVLTSEILAIAPMLEQWNAVMVSNLAKGAQITGEGCAPRLFRVNQSTASDAAALKGWLQTRSEKKWVMMLVDTTFGHDLGKQFAKVAADTGKEIVGEFYAPLGTTDYAPYIQQAKDVAPEGIYIGYGGRDTINFVQQASDFGLFRNAVVAGNSLTYETNIAALGDKLKGAWGGINYSKSIDTPENKAFIESWKKMYGVEPTEVEGQTYEGAHILLEGVRKAGSSDPEAVAQAIGAGSFDTPLGKLTVRAEDHQLMLPNFLGQVRDENGSLQNVASYSLSPDAATPPVDPACDLGN